MATHPTFRLLLGRRMRQTPRHVTFGQNIAMPKLYEYFGLIVMFYANEHEPVHVHGKCQGRESKAEIIVLNGVVTEIRYSEVDGRAPLEFREMKDFQELVSVRANDIVQK